MMLSGIFQKRKKIQELRAPSLQDIKKFRDVYARHAEKRHVEAPSCFEKSIYKAISCQKELHSVDFRQEDVTDPQIIALAEALLEMPIISSLDLRDNRITDDGAKALLEVLRLQIIAAKTPPKTDPRTKKLIPPPQMPEYARYVTSVNLKGNEISSLVLDEMTQYTEILKREDKRLEIRAALNQIDRNSDGGIDEDDFKAVIKLLTGTEPGKKEIKQLMGQSVVTNDSVQNAIALENVLLARCSTSSPSKKSASPPWEAIVQVRHANIGSHHSTQSPFATPAKSTSLNDSRSPVRDAVSIQPSSASAVSQRTQIVSGSMSITPTSATQPPPAPVSQPKQISVAPKSPIAVSPQASPERPKVEFKPPASPPPPLPLPQSTSSDSRTSISGSTSVSPKQTINSDDQGRGLFRLSSDGGSFPSNDRSSGTNGQLFGTRSQEVLEGHRSPVSTPSSPMITSAALQDVSGIDVSTWRDEDVFTDEEDDQSHPGSGDHDDGSAADEDESRKSVVSKASTTSSKQTGASNNNQKPTDADSILADGTDVSDGDTDRQLSRFGESRAQSRDLSSLVYNERPDDKWLEYATTLSPASPESTSARLQAASVDDEDDEEELVDGIVVDVMKGGKPRNAAKLVHSEFKRGLSLQNYPDDVPFRNLVTLILSGNGLHDLSLFGEMRFPCVTVLDLSGNRLVKLNDAELAGFPKLQILNLEENRLKTINGLGKLNDIKALNLSYNSIKAVINIEHLVQLQILKLNGNAISVISSLRLLSLNKMLQNLDLDGNPLVETDDRQRRKVTVHVLNIIPTLRSMGSVPLIGHNSKEKRKVPVTDPSPIGKSFLDFDEAPEWKSTWVSAACDMLQIYQDPAIEHTSNGDYDDPYADLNGTASPNRLNSKKLSREDQRMKDELRSRYIAHRSRGKAPPSPPRVKMSPYAFGPPQAAPPKSPGKKRKVNPELAQKQIRRASELSAPKHAPVDQTLMKQELRRKSRPTFDVNMSVAERLQLVQDKALRRPSSIMMPGDSHRTSMIGGPGAKRGSTVSMAPIHESPSRTDQDDRRRESPTKSQPALEFRIDPYPTDRSVPSRSKPPSATPSPVRIDMASSGPSTKPATVSSPTDRSASVKESNFLQSLAVMDFLSHVEEEFSTALTALTVLLSMSEKESADPNKLKEYRSSLIALDILNERESQELYQKAKCHDDPRKVDECTKAFEKIGVVKKSIKSLLDKLNTHAPGSAVVRAYCRSLRSVELRDIIPHKEESVDAQGSSTSQSSPSRAPQEIDPSREPDSRFRSPETSPLPVASNPATSLHSKLFQHSSLEISPTPSEPSHTKPPSLQESTPPKNESVVDDEFDFLSSDQTIFDDDDVTSLSIEPASSPELSTSKIEAVSISPVVSPPKTKDEVSPPTSRVSSPSQSPTPMQLKELSAAEATDITQDIQLDAWNDEIDQDPEDGASHVDEEDEGEGWKPVDADSDDVMPPHAETEAEVDQTDDLFLESSFLDDTLGDTKGMEEEATDPNAFDDDVQSSHSADETVPAVQGSNDDDDEGTKEDADVNLAADADQDDHEAGGEPADEYAEDDEDDEEAEMFGDWEKGFDPSTNHYFWFNHATGESIWTPPEGWPYEVDTPFEEDAMPDEDVEEEGIEDTMEDIEPQSTRQSTTEADDDLFSDQDLPDF